MNIRPLTLALFMMTGIGTIGAPPSAVATPKSYEGACHLSIGDHVYMSGEHCQIVMEDDGGVQIRNGNNANKYVAM